MTHNQMPFVSVVVCAYNEEKIIKSCLEGLTSQTYPAEFYEILIIENDSLDKTMLVIKNFVKNLSEKSVRVRVLQKKHGGLSESRNVGIEKSFGSIISFIDADAIPKNTWLEEVVNVFSDNKVDFIGGRINLLNKGSWIARFLQDARHHQFFGPKVFNDQFIGCNMAFRRRVFDSIGGFYEFFTSRGDESAVYSKIQKDFSYKSATEAVVYHERPESFFSYFYSEWKSAIIGVTVRNFLSVRNEWKTILLWFELFFIFSFFPLLLISILLSFSYLLINAALCLSIFSIIRRLYMRPVSMALMRGVIGQYGAFKGIVSYTLFQLILSVVQFTGMVFGSLQKPLDKSVVNMRNKVTILYEYDSKSR
jgi:glycosyltransferase involved in cell wall biosynthesis